MAVEFEPASEIRRVLVVVDIEGSSGCWDYTASAFLTDAWADACLALTQDVNAVVSALFEAGTEQVVIRDFHRTGYNLLPELIDPRASFHPGYHRSPVPGIGDPEGTQAVLFIGMHAASGTGGFLAHSFTSRITSLRVNGIPMPEVAFFAASLEPFGLRPIFYSGCPIACGQAGALLPGIDCYPIDKSTGPGGFDTGRWRHGLARAARQSLNNGRTRPFRFQGPFLAEITMRDGERAARKIADRWGYERKLNRLRITSPDIHSLYMEIIRLAYLTPVAEKLLPISLFLFHMKGRLGIEWVRRRLRKKRALPA